MKRFLAIGECMIEMSPTGTPDQFNLGFAGDTFNTCWYMRQLCDARIDVAYLSAVGDDEPSQRMRDFMQSAGITAQLKTRAARTVGLYMIALKNGERSFSYWRDTSAARTLADDLDDLGDLEDGDVVLISGITLAVLPDAGRDRLLQVLADARTKGIRVAFDPNIRPRLWKDSAQMCDWTMKAAQVCDIALPSYEDEATYFDDKDPRATARRYRQAGANLVVVKNGADEMLLEHDDAIFHVAPSPVQQVIDTTAAGDSFNAGFLAAFFGGHSAEAAARHGANVAAQVITARGALVQLDLAALPQALT